MKFLAIECELPNVNWKNAADILAEEAHHVHALYKKDIIREIYFTDDKNAVLILECESKEKALQILNEFPLVKEKYISFDIVTLMPYTGYDRIVK